MLDLSIAQIKKGNQQKVLTSTVRNIGLALFNGFALREVVSILEVFDTANMLAESTSSAARYQIQLLSASGGRVASSSFIHVDTESVEARRQADKLHALFITGGKALHHCLHNEHLVDWLRLAAQNTRYVYPTTEGLLFAEAAGLTEFIGDRRCVVDSVGDSRSPYAQEHPKDALSLRQQALAVVQNDLGPMIAGQIATRVELPVKTSFFPIRNSTSTPWTERIQTAAQWLKAHSDQPISVGAAARLVAMSERNFLRRFKMETGMSPSDYLLKVRLDQSCRFLAETHLPIDKIARCCGFGSGGQFSKIFRANVAMTPTTYRAKFTTTLQAEVQLTIHSPQD